MPLTTPVPLRVPAPPRVVAVTPDSPAAHAGLTVGDEILAIDGVVPRDVLEYRQLIDEADIVVSMRRGGVEFDITVDQTDAVTRCRGAAACSISCAMRQSLRVLFIYNAQGMRRACI